MTAYSKLSGFRASWTLQPPTMPRCVMMSREAERSKDRELFKAAMLEIGQPVIASGIAETVEEALSVAGRIGYPVIVRPALAQVLPVMSFLISSRVYPRAIFAVILAMG